jgi:4-amino-4-deoxy-L-arabinose transferase-like glycosyltransferase
MIDSKGGLRGYLPELLLLLVLGVLLSYNVSLFDLEPTGEFFHLAAAKEGVLQHHFWLPSLNGHAYVLRAPLWTWLMTLSFQFGGLTLSAARVPAILFALVGVALTGLLTQSLTGNRISAWFASAALGTCWGFIHLSVQSGADVAAMDLYLFFLWLLVEWNALAERRNISFQAMDAYSLAMGLSIAVLFLLKDSLSVLVLLIVGLGYVAINQNLALLKKLNPMLLLVPVVLLPLPWLLIGTFGAHHPAFVGESWFIYPFQRLMGQHALGVNPWSHLQGDCLFYLRALPLDLLPYLLFLPMLLVDRFLGQTETGSSQPSLRRLGTTSGGHWERWGLGWFVLGLVVYSCSAFQEPGLLLPFYPPLAMLSGAYFSQAITAGEAHPLRSYQNSLTFLILVLLLTAVFSAILIFQVLPDDYVIGNWHFYGEPMLTTLNLAKFKITLPEAIPLWKLWLTPGPFILLAGGLFLFILQASQRLSLTAPAAIGVFLVFLFFIKGVDLPILNRAVPQQIAQDLNRRFRSGDELTLYSTRPALKQVWFYLKAKPNVRVRFASQDSFFSTTPLVTASASALSAASSLTDPDPSSSPPLPSEADVKNAVSNDKEPVVSLLATSPALPASARQFGVVGEKTYFQDFSANQRELTQVLRYGWSWDHARGTELLKFLLARPPQFNHMKSGLLAFENLSPQSDDLAPDPALQSGNENTTKKKKSHRRHHH